MIVCHCNHVTDRDVARLVRAGAPDADSVLAACGAGNACGGCKPLVRLIIEKERRLRAASPDEEGLDPQGSISRCEAGRASDDESTCA